MMISAPAVMPGLSFKVELGLLTEEDKAKRALASFRETRLCRAIHSALMNSTSSNG